MEKIFTHSMDVVAYPNCEFMCVYFDEQRTRSIHNGFYRFDMQTNHNTARRCVHRRYKTIYLRIVFVTYPYLQYFCIVIKISLRIFIVSVRYWVNVYFHGGNSFDFGSILEFPLDAVVKNG